MKILQIGASWFGHRFSGLERYYAELVTHLPALGFEVTGLVYELKESLKIPGLELVSLGTQDKSLLRRYLDQRRILRSSFKEEIDLVVSHCTPSVFPALGFLRDKPLVCHFHGPRYLERIVEGANAISVQLSKYIEQKVYGRADHVITLSHYMKRLLVENYNFPEERVSVVPGGVDVQRFRPSVSRSEARLRLKFPCDRPLILTVRRLEQRMGLHNLIEAMSEVVRCRPDALLLIAGKGSLEDELRHHIQTLDLSANIWLIGTVTDQVLPLLYRAADFSIVPTTNYEGFGLILIESLASGTPALGTPQGAIPEVLRPFSESLLLESAASRDIAQGILETLKGHRKLPTAEECESYAQTYAWPAVVNKVSAVYCNVVGAYPLVKVKGTEQRKRSEAFPTRRPSF